MVIIFLLLIINVLTIIIIVKYFRFLSPLIKKVYFKYLRFASKNLILFADVLQKLGKRLRNRIAEPTPSLNNNLTPNANADDSGVYLKLLKEKTEDTDAKNIALTGPYGSGKSSILKTFQSQHQTFHFLNISLAAFNDIRIAEKTEDRSNSDTDNKFKKVKYTSQIRIEAIEYSILQQIFYHVKHQQIPFSRFKRIKNLPSYGLFFRAMFFVLWLGILSYLIWHDKLFADTTPWKDYLSWRPDFFKSSLLLYATFYSFYICYM